MLTNKEYARLITALFYASNGESVPLAAVNSLLRMSTDNPGIVTIDAEKKTLVVSESEKRPSFFSRLLYKLSVGQ